MPRKQIDLEEAIALSRVVPVKMMREERAIEVSKPQYYEDPEKRFAHLNAKGQEVLDPTPMAPPVGYEKPVSMVELLRDRVRNEMSRIAEEQGLDSFEDADDFDVGDDFDPRSPHEMDFEPGRKSTRDMLAELREDVTKLVKERDEALKALKDKEKPVDEGSKDS